jgi:hypothetical protein
VADGYIEESLRQQLLTKSAVTALVVDRIRPYKPSQLDTLPFIIIRSNREENQNSLDYRGGLVQGDISVVAAAETIEGARVLATAIRSNNTDPGTGLAGDEWTLAGVTVQASLLLFTEMDFIPFEEGGDAGYYVADAHYKIDFEEVA